MNSNNIGPKVLGVLGSPRRGGICELILDEALRGAKESGGLIEKIVLNEMKIAPCQECGGCDQTGRCIVQDDFQLIYQKLKNFNLFILASPLFFFGVSAQTKLLIDRCQCCWMGKYVLKQPVAEKSERRRGFFIGARGGKGKAGFHSAIKTVKAFFAVNNIIYDGEALFSQTDNSKLREKMQKTIFKQAYQKGQKLHPHLNPLPSRERKKIT
ncbi:MAG: flavodoxin family protein [Elusimicrobiota bacterium]